MSMEVAASGLPFQWQLLLYNSWTTGSGEQKYFVAAEHFEQSVGSICSCSRCWAIYSWSNSPSFMFGRLANTGIVCVAGVIFGENGSKLSELFEVFTSQGWSSDEVLVEIFMLSYSQSWSSSATISMSDMARMSIWLVSSSSAVRSI